MNRKERRKHKSVRYQGKVEMVDPKTIRQASMCIWDGCTAHFDWPMPEGWRWFIAFAAPRPVPSFRDIVPANLEWDAVLCPTHAEALRRSFKNLGRELQGQPAGSA